MNTKCRSLEFYAIKWTFDTSKLDQKEYTTLEDGAVEEDEA